MFKTSKKFFQSPFVLSSLFPYFLMDLCSCPGINVPHQSISVDKTLEPRIVVDFYSSLSCIFGMSTWMVEMLCKYLYTYIWCSMISNDVILMHNLQYIYVNFMFSSISEKQMNLVYEKSVRVFLDLRLGWWKIHLHIQKTWHGILVCL